MSPGKELNLAVAQEVMGIGACEGIALPDYSRSTLLALSVVSRLADMGFGVCIEVFPRCPDTNKLFVVSTYRFKPYELPPLGKSVPLEPPPTESFGIVEGQTEAEAICNAAVNTMRAWRARGGLYVEES